MKEVKVTKNDIKRGIKRLNISLSIKDIDNLKIVSESQKLKPTTLAGSWVALRAKKEASELLKSGYMPKVSRGGNLFSEKK